MGWIWLRFFRNFSTWIWFTWFYSILDVDAFSGLNLFVVDSTVFSGDEIVDDGIVEDSFVLNVELPGCCVVSELVLYELVSSGSFWGCVKSELAKLVSLELPIEVEACSEVEPNSLLELSLDSILY